MTVHFTVKENDVIELVLDDAQVSALEELSKALKSDKEYWRNVAASGFSSDGVELNRDARAIEYRKIDGDVWQLRILNSVGAIGLPGMSITVVPKIPSNHFVYLASYAIGPNIRHSTSIASVSIGEDLAAVLFQWFLNSLEEVLRFGLMRDYRENRGWSHFARGRVLPLKTIFGLYQGKAGAFVEDQAFDEDNSVNRLLKHAALCIVSSSNSQADQKARAKRAVAIMEHVGSMRIADLNFANIPVPREYRQSLEYAIHIVKGAGITLAKGTLGGRTFLIPTPMLIESGIRELLSERLSPLEIRKNGKQLGSTSLTVTPDILVSKPPFTADVKYKISDTFWRRSDLAQAVFFAEAFNSDLGVVVDFSFDESKTLPTVPVGRMQIRSVQWNLGDGWDPESSATRLVNDFERLVPNGNQIGVAIVGSSDTL